MTKSKMYSLLLTFALLMGTLAASSVFVTAPATAQAGGDWPMFHYDAANTGYNPDSAGPYPLRLEWAYKTEGNVHSSPAVVGGKCYIGSDDMYLYCLEAGGAPTVAGGVPTGNLVWKYKTDGAVRSSPAVIGGKVYFGSYDYYVYCVDANSGSLVWKYKTEYVVWGSPTVVNNKVYIVSNDNKFYCLDAATGTLVWKFTTRGAVSTIKPGDIASTYMNMKAAVVNGRVYFGFYDRYLYCLNATTGAKIWENGPRTAGYQESSPCVVGGAIYIGNHDNYWYKYNATTGARIWRILYNEALGVAAPSNNIIQNTAAYAYDTVYYIWPNPHMVARSDPATGKILSMYMQGQLPRSSVAVADGKVYAPNNDRYMYVLDADDMTRLQSFDLPQIIESSPAIAGGKLYVGCANMYVYCWGQGDSQKLNHLTVTPAPRTLSLGTSITLSGGITPYHENGPEGQTITLHYVRPDGTVVTTTTASQAAGIYSATYAPDMEGNWKVKATWAGNPWWLGSESYYQTFTVTAAVAKPTTTISASVSNTTIVPGDSVTVSGAITPAVAGVTVTLTYTKPDATTITRTSVSASAGAYTDTYTPDAEGNWNVKASWPGSDTYQSATSSAAAFTVSAAEEQPTGAAIPMEIIYAVVAIIVIAIVAVVGYWYMKRPKK